ncbi:hypothetical protein ACFVH0_16625 [Streptomyces sp. NPDC127117]|uniref:hypothetical protein n=1 Tax=Streptomyces sp. NPDC127117 TaxID=3345368 RepID=UPI0036455F1F
MLACLEARFQAILGNFTDSEAAAGRAENAFTGSVPGNELGPRPSLQGSPIS